IGLGILTFSKRVMGTVGTRLVRLDAFSAFIVLLSEAITVHAYSLIGVPVSTSQAVIGAVIGIGFIKGIQTVDKKTLGGIFIGWSLTPLVACFISVAIYFVKHLKYLPPG
ncbi:MAG: inorganic phosphate transporter, partial [Deltaproteobacteria bacterium]|nr:inorganic phosphate transporter [Deltaproteobacteria bacterium]